VDHHLVPLARRPRIEPMMQGRLREQRQGVGLQLYRRR
jgi:hypothetical protein